MPVSRRGFLRILGTERSGPMSGAFLAARGLEAYFADTQRGRAARPPLPPGVEEIRISSNENPLGPGKTALDAILGKFPEAGRYPFNSTPGENDARRRRSPRSRRSSPKTSCWRRLAGDPEERGPGVHVAVPRRS